MENPLELIEKYAKEIELDTQIDITNIMEKQLSAPNIKHKWLYRMTQSKRQLFKLFELKEDMLSKELNSNVLNLPKASISRKLDNSADMMKLNRLIREQELLIEYLDNNVNKVFSQMGFDFRNIVELMKMEQL
jgi:hypothetical protein